MKPCLLVASLVATAAAAGQKPPDLPSLVAAEVAFAKMSETSGFRDAFLANLAEGAIVFRPRPVEGRPVYEKLPPSPAHLTWYPAWADISAAGDLGYTTGPYRMFAARTDQAPVRQGHYVTLWKRSSGGPWKAVLDAGISHGPLPSLPPLFNPEPGPNWERVTPAANPSAEAKTLLGLETALSEKASTRAAFDVLLEAAGPDGRFYRAGFLPAKGRDEARALPAEKPGPVAWSPMKAVVSESGDLGFTYGIASWTSAGGAGPPALSSYLRIWKKRAGRWEVVLDLATPIPPEEKK
jgi:ketosteroid isomerase-like protein